MTVELGALIAAVILVIYNLRVGADFLRTRRPLGPFVR